MVLRELMRPVSDERVAKEPMCEWSLGGVFDVIVIEREFGGYIQCKNMQGVDICSKYRTNTGQIFIPQRHKRGVKQALSSSECTAIATRYRLEWLEHDTSITTVDVSRVRILFQSGPC